MNKKLVTVALSLLLPMSCFAYTCTDDAEAMTKVIRTQHVVYTKNNWQVLEIFLEHEVKLNQCQANCGDYTSAFNCVWSKGNWQKTVMAYK